MTLTEKASLFVINSEQANNVELKVCYLYIASPLDDVFEMTSSIEYSIMI